MDGVTSYFNDMHNLKATELRLGLLGSDDNATEKQSNLAAQKSNKRSLPGDSETAIGKALDAKDAPVAKAQIVGWPPIRAYRKNNFLAKKMEAAEASGLYVKVSMDGAPYLRKIDIKVYKGYKELREALEDMFKCFSVGEVSGCNNGCDYAIAYEDKDGDLMLVGDVPWEMFIDSCKRLRIMKGSEVKGFGSS